MGCGWPLWEETVSLRVWCLVGWLCSRVYGKFSISRSVWATEIGLYGHEGKRHECWTELKKVGVNLGRAKRWTWLKYSVWNSQHTKKVLFFKKNPLSYRLRIWNSCLIWEILLYKTPQSCPGEEDQRVVTWELQQDLGKVGELQILPEWDWDALRLLIWALGWGKPVPVRRLPLRKECSSTWGPHSLYFADIKKQTKWSHLGACFSSSSFCEGRRQRQNCGDEIHDPFGRWGPNKEE